MNIILFIFFLYSIVLFSIWRRERGKKRGREISGGNCGRRRRRKKKKKKREKNLSKSNINWLVIHVL